MKYRLECIKCKQPYDTDDPDPYYCDGCFKETRKIAKEVDAKMASKPKRSIKSNYQIYDEICKQRGTPFIKASDLSLFQ